MVPNSGSPCHIFVSANIVHIRLKWHSLHSFLHQITTTQHQHPNHSPSLTCGHFVFIEALTAIQTHHYIFNNTSTRKGKIPHHHQALLDHLSTIYFLKLYDSRILYLSTFRKKNRSYCLLVPKSMGARDNANISSFLCPNEVIFYGTTSCINHSHMICMCNLFVDHVYLQKSIVSKCYTRYFFLCSCVIFHF